jgi:hypothetical protein
MAARFPQMLTANRLRDGEAVYWKGGDWVTELKNGQVFPDEAAAEAAIKAAEGAVKANIVVNPYIFDVRITDGAIRPVKEKDVIRSAGPSVHTNLGKQARHV